MERRNPMPVPAHHIMTAVLNDKVYVFGGFVVARSSGETGAEAAGWAATDRSWMYDPALRQWKELKRMPTPRSAGWAVILGNKIYVLGGAQSGVHSNPTAPLKPGAPQRVLDTVEVYDPARDQRRSSSPMPTPRNHFVAAAVNGKIYAIGGRLGSAMITFADDTNVVEEDDPTTDQWTGKGR